MSALLLGASYLPRERLLTSAAGLAGPRLDASPLQQAPEGSLRREPVALFRPWSLNIQALTCPQLPGSF